MYDNDKRIWSWGREAAKWNFSLKSKIWPGFRTTKINLIFRANLLIHSFTYTNQWVCILCSSEAWEAWNELLFFYAWWINLYLCFGKMVAIKIQKQRFIFEDLETRPGSHKRDCYDTDLEAKSRRKFSFGGRPDWRLYINLGRHRVRFPPRMSSVLVEDVWHCVCVCVLVCLCALSVGANTWVRQLFYWAVM